MEATRFLPSSCLMTLLHEVKAKPTKAALSQDWAAFFIAFVLLLFWLLMAESKIPR